MISFASVTDRVPIRYRVALYSFIAGTLLVAFVVQQTVGSSKAGLEKQFMQRSESVLDTVTAMSVEPLLTEEFSAHSDLLVRLSTNEEIDTADLVDVNGLVVASSDPARIGVNDRTDGLAAAVQSNESVMSSTVIVSSGTIGFVRVSFNDTQNAVVLAQDRRRGWTAGAIGVPLVALVSLLGGWAFTRRLSMLESHVADVDAAGEPELLDVRGQDEIARLGVALNERTLRLHEELVRSKEARDALRLSEATLKLAVAAAADGVFEYNLAEESFRLIGPASNDDALLGMDALAGDQLRQRLHPDDEPFASATLARAIRTPSGPKEIELRVEDEDGAWRTVLARMQALEGDGGTVERVLIAVLDVTDQRAIERRMFHADKMQTIGQLASGIAHDFNNALAVSMLIISALEDTGRNRGDDDHLIERLSKANEHAVAIVNRLLLQAGPQEHAPDVIDLNRLIGSLDGLLAPLLGGGVEIVFDLGAEDSSVLIDESRAQQMIFNLARNAADAMEGRGRLTIRTFNAAVTPRGPSETDTPSDPALVLMLIDTGPGIDPALLAVMFDPFVTTKSAGTGTGLGLSTTWETVVGSGGTISATNNEDGVGATFTIFLPVAVEDHVSEPPEDPEVPSRDKRILVVDDHRDVLRSVASTLRVDGYGVSEVDSPAAALMLLADHDFDLLLTDVQLPELSGLELAKRVNDLRPGLRVVFMSAFRPNDADLVVMQGRFVQKPFSRKEILSLVGETLAEATESSEKAL